MTLVITVFGILLLSCHSLGQKYDYKEALMKSVLFYEAQRNGKLPASNRIPFRGDSCLNDGSDVGLDLTGGWFDAGDHVKFGFPMAWAVTMVTWGVVDFRDGYRKAGELDNVLDSLKWVFDYFIRCHVSKYEFYGQVGDGHADHAFWGRPEEMTMSRPAWSITQTKPGSDLAAETAAAMAAGYLAFRGTQPTYADTLLSHARDLFDFAYEYRGIYSESIPNAASFYRSFSGYNDEFVWGGAWMYRATGEQVYLDRAEEFYNNKLPWGFSWDDKTPGGMLMMYITTKQDKYLNDVIACVDNYLPSGSVPYTPKGLAWRDQWGSLRYAANMAAVALIAAQHGVKEQAYTQWAESQINYILGDTGRSFLCGYGVNPPTQPHHRAASCPDPPATCDWGNYHSSGPNPQTLHGALVGGPDQSDNYVDHRGDYRANEVAIDYNAGFQTAIAGMCAIYY